MAVLMKVKSCCCGCSLELGTQIIFWLNVVSGICALGGSFIVSSAGTSGSLVIYRAVVWPAVFAGIICGIGLYGVAYKKAQLLLPYLIQSVIVLITVGLCIVVVFLTAIFASDVAKAAARMAQKRNSKYDYGLGNKVDYSSSDNNADTVAIGVVALVIVVLVILCISFALNWYFTSVVYSYYCQLKEEETRMQAPIVGPGYVVPPEQGQPCNNSYFPQPPPGYYFPAHDQPAAVYPTK